MDKIYKYKVPLFTLLSHSYAIIIALGALFFPILIALKYGLKGTSIFILILILVVGVLIVPFTLFVSIKYIHEFIENRRHPNIIVNDEYILLPFDDNKKRVKILFSNINECKESYTSTNKKKNSFIYLSSKLNKNENYRLYKENMNTLEYDELKNDLLKRINDKQR